MIISKKRQKKKKTNGGNKLFFQKLILAFPGLKIISGESSDKMTGQIHFSSAMYRFWPAIFLRRITLKTRVHEQKLALSISKK